MDWKERERILNTHNSFFRIFHLNHLLMGEDYDFIREFGKKHGEVFNLDFREYHLLLTGQPCKTIADWAGMGTEEQMDLYVNARRGIRAFLMDHGYQCEVFPADCIRSRQIVVLFFPAPGCRMSPEKAADQIHEIVHMAYSHSGQIRDMPTMLKEGLSGKQAIAEGFQRLLEMERLAFFLRGQAVITEEQIGKNKIPFDERDAFILVNEIEEQIFLHHEEEVSQRTAILFNKRLKNAMDRRLVQEVLSMIRRKFRNWDAMFILDTTDRQGTFEVEAYDYIEETAERMEDLFLHASHRIAAQPNGKSCVTREAVRYIQKNYLRDINQADIAENINVTRPHLSRMFNKDMQMSIPAYLTKLRMEKAKELLLQTQMKVSEIAGSTGFTDMAHFIRVFKRTEGVTPGRFREQNR